LRHHRRGVDQSVQLGQEAGWPRGSAQGAIPLFKIRMLQCAQRMLLVLPKRQKGHQ
jgi:hypothetical protein